MKENGISIVTHCHDLDAAIPSTETTSNELRFKARRFFDGALQAASEDLRTYIIRFDNIVSNLKKTYGGAYETSFNELEIVQKILNAIAGIDLGYKSSCFS